MNPFKSCGCCGATYTEEQWRERPLLGNQPAGEDDGVRFWLEMKNCACGSTLGIEHQELIRRPEDDAHAARPTDAPSSAPGSNRESPSRAENGPRELGAEDSSSAPVAQSGLLALAICLAIPVMAACGGVAPSDSTDASTGATTGPARSEGATSSNHPPSSSVSASSGSSGSSDTQSGASTSGSTVSASSGGGASGTGSGSSGGASSTTGGLECIPLYGVAGGDYYPGRWQCCSGGEDVPCAGDVSCPDGFSDEFMCCPVGLVNLDVTNCCPGQTQTFSGDGFLGTCT